MREIGNSKIFSTNHSPKVTPIIPAIKEYIQVEERYWSTDMEI
jgi:hypothetical protein